MKDPATMIGSELRDWLRDRLQMKGEAAADLDPRSGESPYEGVLRLWESGSSDFQKEITRAVKFLIKEAMTEPWHPDHFHELGTLIEAGDLFEVSSTLEDLTHTSPSDGNDQRAQLHMLALRTLLGLGWKGTPEFWLAQKETVGARWPALIFHGLVRHDLARAFDELPSMLQREEDMARVLDLFPGLMRELNVGIGELKQNCQRIADALPPRAAEALREWFLEREPPTPPRNRQGLWEALRDTLDRDRAPRTPAVSIEEMEEDRVWDLVREIKSNDLDWENTTGSVRKWWESFEEENRHRPFVILRLAKELQKREATIREFFLASVYSNTDNIQANVHYLDYRRLKDRDDKD